jgi:hypothetical protein
MAGIWIDMSLPILPDDEALSAKPVYFNQDAVGTASNRYICWLDVMGSGNTMGRSMAISANFIMKLHVAILESRGLATSIELYPMIDGLYACTQTAQEMFSFLKSVFIRLAVSFVSESSHLYRFVVRGGISYGPVVRQTDVQPGSAVLGLLLGMDYCERILVGLPLAQAYNEERVAAPPFGVAMHESIRAFGHIGTGPVSGRYWKWWEWSQTAGDIFLVNFLGQELTSYYDWCRKHSAAIGYGEDRIEAHEKLVRDYFSDERRW